jgi:hypothetical protein
MFSYPLYGPSIDPLSAAVVAPLWPQTGQNGWELYEAHAGNALTCWFVGWR